MSTDASPAVPPADEQGAAQGEARRPRAAAARDAQQARERQYQVPGTPPLRLSAGETKKRYDPIPGLNGTTYFDKPETAAAAQATAAQLLFASGPEGPRLCGPRGCPV
eukprot:7389612-Prymnesium_polylepis.1